MCAKKRTQRVYSLLQAAPCINKHNSKIAKCMDAMSFAFGGIKRAPNHLKMPHICCQYVELNKCFRTVMVANGCEKQLPTLQDQIHNVMGNYIDSSCGQYSADNDSCDKLGSPPKPSKEDKKKNKFIKNLVDIFDSID